MSKKSSDSNASSKAHQEKSSRAKDDPETVATDRGVIPEIPVLGWKKNGGNNFRVFKIDFNHYVLRKFALLGNFVESGEYETYPPIEPPKRSNETPVKMVMSPWSLFQSSRNKSC